MMAKYGQKKHFEHRRLYLVLTLLLLLFSASIAGYMFLEHYSFLEALYMTVITVTTVGFKEVRPLNSSGVILTIGVILAGFMVLAVSAQTIMSAVFENIVSRSMGHHKMEKEIATLEGHYIVCGLGRVGEAAVERLSREKIDFVVIEMNEELAEKLKRKDQFTLVGNCTDEEILLKAGIKKARGLLVLTSAETENLYITLTARELNPTLQIIARGENLSSERKLKRAGADEVISPYTFAGVQIAEKVLLATDNKTVVLPESPHAPEWISAGSESEWVGQPLASVTSAEKWHILGIRRGKKDRLFPPLDMKVKKGDELLILRDVVSTEKRARRNTVLIVEDNKVTANLYVRILRRENFVTKYVTNGFEAIQTIESEKPDVAVIDNMLPGMSGIEVCRAVREQPELNSVRLILFTGDEHPETKRRALESGADAFLLKTAEATLLVEKIRAVLGEIGHDANDLQTPPKEENPPQEIENAPDSSASLPKTTPETNSQAPVPIDLPDAFDRCGNDWDFFSEMFGEFVDYVPEQIRKIKKAYAERNWEMLHSEGHRFKGAAANFGATELTSLARQVEEAGRNREDVGLDDLIRRMEEREKILRRFRETTNPALVTDLAK